MNPSKPLYLFFDLDGTVLIDRKLPKLNLDAMRRAQRLGHKLILNTGRSRGSYARVASLTDVPWDGMCFGAADINVQGENISLKTIGEQDFLIWLDYCIEHRVCLCYGGRERLEFLDFSAYDHPLTADERHAAVKYATSLYRQDPLTNFSVQCVIPKGTMPESGLTPIQLSTYADVFPRGCNKGNVILEFCRATGAPLESCVCFGDSANDIDMFRVCPIGVCMKNAPPELAALATYRAQSDCGVAEGLAWLLGAAEDEI